MGDNFSWVGTGSGAFGDPLDWIDTTIDQYGVPGPSDNAAIILASGVIPGNGTVSNLVIGGSTLMPLAITFTGAITAQHLGLAGDSSVTVSGGKLTGTTTFTSNDGDSISVSNGGTLVGPTSAFEEIANFGAIDLNGGEIDSYHLQVFGTLTMESGNIGVTEMGVANSTHGTASMVATGGIIQADTGFVGGGSDYAGDASVSGGAVWHNRKELDIATGGDGVLDISGGGRVDAGGGNTGSGAVLVEGYGSGVTGLVSIDGSGSALTSDGDAQIGYNTAAAVVATAEGSLDVTGTLDIGVQGGASGTVSVDGNGLVTADAITVGDSGAGTLQATGGGVVTTSGNITVGAAAGGSGDAIVGSGGNLHTSGTLTIGAGGAGTLDLDSSGTASVASAIVGTTGSILAAGGTLTATSITVAGTVDGYGSISGPVTNSAAISAAGGTLTLANDVQGTGTLQVGDGSKAGELELSGGAAASQTIAFSSGTLILDQLSATKAPIAGFATDDVIELHAAADAAQFNAGTLTITLVSVPVGTLSLQGAYQTKNFKVTPLGGAVTDIIFQPIQCFAAGTRIATPDGEVPVEALAVGRSVTLADGGTAPVLWMGYRHVNARPHPSPRKVWPVRISTGAFGDGRPCRDLLLSPDHAVFFDDVLIPVKALINGRTVVQMPVDAIDYYHVELPRHDVVLAEGLAVESYLDTGDRANFANGGAVVRLHPDLAACKREACACAPLVLTGPRVAAARNWLTAVAGRRAVPHAGIAA